MVELAQRARGRRGWCASSVSPWGARLGVQLRARDDDRILPPSIIAYPAGTPDEKMARGHIIDKPSGRLVIAY